MAKVFHEIRDPIHVFVHIDDEERRVIDSLPVQRLRQIHQLATTYLVYPGATHRRFEHSLGVMELAGKVFDIVANPALIHREIRDLLPNIQRDDWRQYWRRVVRLAGLCHDIGHLPFSHAAEEELLPDDCKHENLTVQLLHTPEMEELWQAMRPLPRADDIAKLAVGQKYLPNETFSDWEAILSEIIIGDAFGVDRMDYLLRDSLHAGVAYGRFDHFRLVDTLRILPPPASDGHIPRDESEQEISQAIQSSRSKEPQLGVEEGGLHSAEALLLARYFMYTQVYFHPVRRIYDIHLRDFLIEWLPEGRFPVESEAFLELTDAEIIAAIAKAAKDHSAPGHVHARRIVRREHFRVLWERNPSDLRANPNAGKAIFNAAVARYGSDMVRRDRYSPKVATIDFPVLLRNGQIVSAQSISEVLRSLPTTAFEYVFIERNLVNDAKQWLTTNREKILNQPSEEA